MKKRLIAFTLVLVLALSLCMPAMAANVQKLWTDITYRGISIVINGVEIAPCDEKGNSTEPFIMNDTTYLPVRAIAGALGLNVGWEAATSTVVLESGGEANYGNGNPTASFNVKHVEITYRGTKISLDGENIPLINRNGESVEPFIYNGTNYLPLRVVSEALGLSVGWDGATSTVTLKGSAQPNEPKPEEPKPEEPKPEEPKPEEPKPELTWVPTTMKYSGGRTGGVMEELYRLNFEYDSKGRLENLSSSDGTMGLSCVYDDLDRLSYASFLMNGVNENHQIVYADNGDVAAVLVNGKIREGYFSETDEQGRIIRELYIENGIPVRYEYEYSETGVLLGTVDVKGETNIVTKYSYDEQGRVSAEEELYNGHLNHHKYEYAADGKSYVKYECVNEEGYGTRWEYSLNDEGLIGRAVLYYFGNETPAEIYDYEYDAKGRCIKETRTTDFIKEEHFYEFDSRGFKVRHENKNYSPENWEEAGKFRHTGTFIESWVYGDDGSLIKNCKKNLLADGTQLDYLEYYWINDEAGRPLKQHYEGDDGYKYRLEWKYDAAGNVTYEKIEKLAGADTVERSEYVYTYNAKGNLTKLSYTDNRGNSLTETYVYDYLDRIAYFNTNENGSASITTFVYNSQNMPTKMETKSYTLGVSVVVDIEYTQVAKTAEDAFVVFFVDQITG